MRKLIFSILLASAAASPALAQDHGRWHNDEADGDRQAAHEQRQEQRQQAREQRGNGGGEAAAVQQQPQPQQQPQAQPQFEAHRQQWQGGNFGGRQQNEAQQQQQQQQWQGRGGFEGRRFEQRDVQSQVQAPQVDQQRQFDRRDRGNWNGGDLRQGERQVPNVMRDRNSTIVNDPRWQAQNHNWQNRNGQSGNWQNRSWANGGWNRDWRNDRRYDWRRYRDSHRSTFRIGIYFDPFGYSYRPFNIGYRLQPFYYQQRYWIDPGMYQLPYPPPGTMWVRYWDDALLVDMYSGEVIDVIRDFFW